MLKIVAALHQDFVGGVEIASSKKGPSQSDPVSMAIYCIGVTLLINMLIHILSNEYSANFNVTAHADEFSAAGNFKNLRRWWSVLTEIGPKKVESTFFRTKLKTATQFADNLEDQLVQESLKTYTSRQ